MRKLLLISFKKDWIEPNALFLNLRRQEYLDVSLPSLFFSVALSVIGYKHPAKQGQIIYRLTLKILYGKLWIAFKYLPQVSEKKNGEEEQEDKEKTEQSEVKKSTDQRRICICPIQAGDKPCGFERLSNNTSLANHECPLLNCKQLTTVYEPAHDDYNPFTLLPPKPLSSLTPLQTTSTALLTYALAGTPISHKLVSSNSFKHFMYGLIHLGQLFPEMDPTEILPAINRKKLPTLFQIHATSSLLTYLQQFRYRYVSLLFDAGDLHGTHIMAVCIAPLEMNKPPRFFQITYGPWTKNDYILFLNQLLSILDENKIKVISICTDGLPVQVSAIEACRNRLLSGGHVGTFIPALIPFHVPCLNHRINNVIKDVFEKHPLLQTIINKMRTFANNARTEPYKRRLHTKCPKFIQTRWFYLINIASYIRMNRQTILAQQWLSRTDIVDIIKIELLLIPMIDLQHFFEWQTVKLSHAYPAVIRTLFLLLYLANSPPFSSGKWLHIIVHLTTAVYNRILTGYLGDLLELSFSLSPCGRQFFRAGIRAVGYHPGNNMLACKILSEKASIFYNNIFEVQQDSAESETVSWTDAFVSLQQLFNGVASKQSSESTSSEEKKSGTDSTSQQRSTTTTDNDDPLFGPCIPTDTLPAVEDVSLSDTQNTENHQTHTEQKTDKSTDEHQASHDSPPSGTESSTSSSASSSETQTKGGETTRRSFVFRLPPVLDKSDLLPVSIQPSHLPLSIPLIKKQIDFSDTNVQTQNIDLRSINKELFNTTPTAETERMSVTDLLYILNKVETDISFVELLQLAIQFEAEEDSLSADISANEYEEAYQPATKPTSQPKRRTRRLPVRTNRRARVAQVESDESSLNSEGSKHEESDGEDVIIISATAPIVHPILSDPNEESIKYDDKNEWKTLTNIFSSIWTWSPGLMEKKFDTFLDLVLPPNLLPMKSELITLYCNTLYSEHNTQDYSTAEAQLVFDVNRASPRRIYALIVSSLIASMLSESECERIFSMAGYIHPPRRSQANLVTLNHSLLIHYGVRPFVPKTRSDLPSFIGNT